VGWSVPAACQRFCSGYENGWQAQASTLGAGSYENLLHAASAGRGGGFALDFRGERGELTRALAGSLLERAIGVIYKPRTERLSHYFDACAPATHIALTFACMGCCSTHAQYSSG
jgi:erythromycin esterase-like protein